MPRDPLPAPLKGPRSRHLWMSLHAGFEYEWPRPLEDANPCPRETRGEDRRRSATPSLVLMAFLGNKGARSDLPDRSRRKAQAVVELFVGCSLLGMATLAGLAFVHRPWPDRVDIIGFRLFPADWLSKWAADVTNIGSVPVLVASVAILCVIAVASRDWVRALSCVIGPAGAVLAVQLVAKPLFSSERERVTPGPGFSLIREVEPRRSARRAP